MFNVFKRSCIEPGQIWRDRKEFLYTEIEILNVGKHNVLYRFVTLEGRPHGLSKCYEASKGVIRMNYHRVK